MSLDVTIVDFGRGNLLSVSRALEYCGANVKFARTPLEIKNAGHLVLPGVGAFRDAMVQLEAQELIFPLKEHGISGRPLLGICLGMQIMLDTGEEFGKYDGLGIIPGRVVAIPNVNSRGARHKIPHIGWNELLPSDGKNGWAGSILQKTDPGNAAYFTHSFQCDPKSAECNIAECNYNEHTITAVIRSNNVYGCQFHPEKSGAVGLKILSQFLEI